MALIFLFIQIFMTLFGKSFKSVLRKEKFRGFAETIKHVGLIISVTVFHLFTTQKGEEYPRITLVATGILHVIVNYIARVYWKRYLLTRDLGGKDKRSLLILASKGAVGEMIQNMLNRNYERSHIIDISLIDVGRVDRVMDGVAIMTGEDGVTGYMYREWVDEVFVNLPRDIPLPQEPMDDFTEMGITAHLELIEMGVLKGQI